MIRIAWGVNPWLTVVTLHLAGRPRMVANSLRSVMAQTVAVEQLLVEDPKPDGSGFAWATDMLRALAREPLGQYVMTLDDDDLLCEPAQLEAIRDEVGDAEVAVCKFDFTNSTGLTPIIPEPAYWGQYPLVGHITGGCVLARRDVWAAHLQNMVDIGNGVYAADYSLIKSYFDERRRIVWVDRVLARSQMRGLGRPETVTNGV